MAAGHPVDCVDRVGPDPQEEAPGQAEEWAQKGARITKGNLTHLHFFAAIRSAQD
jgi:hypothetical protein